MAKQLTGTIAWAGDHWKVRVRMKDGTRPWVHLPAGTTEAQARERAKKLARLARDRGTVKVADGASMNRPTETVAQWSERWLAFRVEKGYTSVCDDRGRLSAHILPVLGSVYIREVTRTHVEDLVEKLDAKVRRGDCSWKTAWNVGGVVTKMFSDACRSKQRALRVREDNPSANVPAPDRGVRKVKAYLYPSEFLMLMECEAVPLAWRCLFAIAVYLYARSGELRALQIEDLDFDHGTVHIHRSESQRRNIVKGTKTGVGRRFSLESEVVPLLRALVGERNEGPVLEDMPTEGTLSRALRLYLKRAGLKRRELFEGGDTRKNITFHDLRATGITWLAVRGDEPLKIKSRAGHSGFGTTEGYIREAEHVTAGFGTVFPKLPAGLVHWSRIGPEEPPPETHLSETMKQTIAERAGFEGASGFAVPCKSKTISLTRPRTASAKTSRDSRSLTRVRRASCGTSWGRSRPCSRSCARRL